MREMGLEAEVAELRKELMDVTRQRDELERAIRQALNVWSLPGIASTYLTAALAKVGA